jgi:cardiolipin synthase
MNLANGLTVSRLILVPVLVYLLHEQAYATALAVFVLAGITDAADGFVAKRWNQVTRLGATLDPIADKGLVVAAYITLAWLQWIPFWLVLVVVSRDVIIVTGAALYHYLTGALEMAPTVLSKANTAIQLTYIAATLLDAALGAAWARPEVGLPLLVGGATVASGLQYVVVWLGKAVRYERGEG